MKIDVQKLHWIVNKFRHCDLTMTSKVISTYAKVIFENWTFLLEYCQLKFIRSFDMQTQNLVKVKLRFLTMFVWTILGLVIFCSYTTTYDTLPCWPDTGTCVPPLSGQHIVPTED